MLVLLPPSETKRPGGDPGSALDLDRLAHPALTRARRAALAELTLLSKNLRSAATALKLGPRSIGEAALNRDVRRSPVMPAIDRFDGVLFDALDAATLGPESRDFAADHLRVASALFGLVGALDPIPTYRLSAGTPLPRTSLRAIWSETLAAEIASHPGLIIDLRSDAYRALGPVGSHPLAVSVILVTQGDDGAVRPLNHFSKHGKGVFTRALLEDRAALTSLDDLLEWGRARGFRLDPLAAGTVQLLL